MFELPKECYVNKFIAKKVFYEKIGLSSTVKNDFIDLVDRITWLYKLSPDTVGISKTEEVEEIEIFQIDLKERVIPNSIIKAITKCIPYKILFVLKFEEDYCYVVKVEDIYNTNWNEDINFKFDYINLSILYENIIKKVIKEESNNKSFKEIIDNKCRIDELNKEINKVRIKMKNEKQFDRKVELNINLNKLLNELEESNNE